MRILAHISDLHFGAVRPGIVAALKAAIDELGPDLVVVSGDLTQRARRSQFEEAQQFLRSLPFPQIVVPGNHDVPLYNLYTRFRRQLYRYKRYIAADTEPFFVDDEIAVLGINTARSLTFKNGRVNQRQVALACERLGNLTGVTKIIVTHHPFDLPQEYPERALVGRARAAMTALARCGIDVFLAGHHHVGLSQPGTVRFEVSGHSSLLVQAGTATSTRSRGQSNSFNIIHIASPFITVERFIWNAGPPPEFNIASTEWFRRTDTGWTRCAAPAALSQSSAGTI